MRFAELLESGGHGRWVKFHGGHAFDHPDLWFAVTGSGAVLDLSVKWRHRPDAPTWYAASILKGSSRFAHERDPLRAAWSEGLIALQHTMAREKAGMVANNQYIAPNQETGQILWDAIDQALKSMPDDPVGGRP